ncbi:DVU_1553 family AMP-dependent CoA ligase [Clostridium estertheticum]|uniref:Phenylacetate--CoA ligase family protein n=1 Tax=Clostridium estertheticum TaxID=238834 RepID=A0A7Y3SSQ6_9CLOT|nr:AMP-binding protein [Clostridium estertheticum]NNU74676.1 phenylacetate--CoA ligase family protein [Clostridium estertheticum]WBL48832.1 AMP-binding protein [Clostridium estertheticum]
MLKTLYEKWMEDKIFMETGDKKLSGESLRLYQLGEIRKVINLSKESKFYGKKLKNIFSDEIKSFEDFKKVPFTTSDDLAKNPKSFLCTTLDQISRIVTMTSSGTTGEPKRIFFTKNDLKATSDFFKYGMLNIVTPGQRVLILMPGKSTHSIGQLLKEGLNEAGCEGIIYGPVFNVWDALETIKLKNIDCIVGLPTQVFYLAKIKLTDVRYRHLKLKSVLLSGDYVPRTLCSAVSSAFSCQVFTHYGMTEMGYGGGVECSAINGYHMRDVDLYTEIIDPVTGRNVTDGSYGEVVITTFRREAMPLIRYRTGDIARFLPRNCSCSNLFKRMDYVKGRVDEHLKLKDGKFLSIGMIDEVMFGIDNVLDYSASINEGENKVLSISVKPVNPKIPIKFNEIKNCIRQDKYLGLLIENNNISIEFGGLLNNIEISNGMIKRKLYCLN